MPQVNELVKQIYQHYAANWNVFNLPTGTVRLIPDIQPDIYQGDEVVHKLLSALLKAMNMCLDLENVLVPLTASLRVPNDYSTVPSCQGPDRKTTLVEFRDLVLNVITREVSNVSTPVGSYNYACMQAVRTFRSAHKLHEDAYNKCYNAIASLHKVEGPSNASSYTAAGWVYSSILGMFD